MINMNTNASKPDILERLFKAGLDSIRVSLNSVRKEYYLKYYKPADYQFNDVLESITLAKKMKKFVSVNYLVMPGFTDAPEEFNALKRFISGYKIDMIQWRNLNYDPLMYFKELGIKVSAGQTLGIKNIIRYLQKNNPSLMMGYFNPSKARIRRKN